MDTDSIVDVPSDNPETYCRLCFSGFYVEPVFPPDGPPKQSLIDMVGQHFDIHITAQTDFPCAVCRMCQMTLESFHKYRERCRRLDEVLQRKRVELAEGVRVKMEPAEKQAAARKEAPGFEQDTVYCLSDSDDDDEDDDDEEGGNAGGEPEEDYGEENDADEEDLIRGDILIKAEPEDGGEGQEGQRKSKRVAAAAVSASPVARPSVPRKIEHVDKDEVVILDSEEEQDQEEEEEQSTTHDGEQSMAAPSTRASSEAPTEDASPDKELPVEITDDGGYRCKICQNIFEKMNEVKKHIRKDHPREAQVYTCQYCPKKFNNRNAMSNHARYHTMDFPFSCDDCGAKFVTKQRLDGHVSRYHDKNSPNYTENRYQCELCPRIFLTVQARVIHLTHFHEVPVEGKTKKERSRNFPKIPSYYVQYCTPCDDSFDTPELANAHVAEHHTADFTLEKRTKCPDCGKLFRHRAAFRSHTLTNHGTMPHVCDICGSGFVREGSLNDHKKRWHDDEAADKVLERYKCDQCERFFMRNQDRIRHEQVIHHIETPSKLPAVFEGRKKDFPCSKCDRKFISMRTMRIHFSLKHPEVAVRFKCTICSKRFRQQEALRDHIASHSGENPYGCDHCEDRFTCKEDQDAHMRELHEQGASDDEGRRTKRFRCFYCPRKLLTKNARGMHIRHAHPGKDPNASFNSELLSSLPRSLTCPHCPKSFNNKNTLKLHVLNHLGKLPHHCSECDAGFYKPADLERHKQRYHSEGAALSPASRFKCAYCPRVFVRKSARRYHHTVFHGVKTTRGGKVPSTTTQKVSALKRRYIKMDPDFRYPCALCTLVFVTGDMLQTHHQQQHPEHEFFFKCPNCPKRMTHRKAFISHMKMHLDGYRHNCDECSAQFNLPSALLNHKKRYHGPNGRLTAMFKCTMCTREFARNQDRVRHQVQMHNYRVGTSANPRPGPSKTTAGRSLLKIKIKQERMDPPAAIVKPQQSPPPAAPTTEEAQKFSEKAAAAKDGFFVSSDVEEDEYDETTRGAQQQQQQQQPEEEDVPSTVPTITSVVSIKEEVIAARMAGQESEY